MQYNKKDILKILTFDNLVNINYYYSNKRLNILNRKIRPKILIPSIFYSIILFFVKWIKQSLILNAYNQKVNDKPIMITSFTKNQRDAVKNLITERNDVLVIGDKNFGDLILPEYKAFYYSLPYLWDLTKKYKSSKGYVRKSFKYIFHDYWLTYGYLKMLINYLKKNKVNLVIVSNDHSMRTRIPILACKAINIKSLYLQHASIGSKFPRLAYDFALLEGLDSLDKYMKIGKIDSTVFLIGSLKMAGKVSINSKNKIHIIGICFGLNDSLDIVEDVIKEMLKIFIGKEIILRCHPREVRLNFLTKMKTKYEIRISDSRKHHVVNFLAETDSIISGESNIHLEAASMNVLPIFYKLSKDKNEEFDVYGFIRNNLIKNICHSTDELSSIILIQKEQREKVRHLTKYYDSTVNSMYEGNTKELYKQVVTFINTGDSQFIDKNFDCKIIKGVKVYCIKNNL